MDAETADWFVRGAIRLSLAGYTIAVAGWLAESLGAASCAQTSGAALARAAWLRWAWTAGCLLAWLHVGAAFHLVHAWRHAAAEAATAAETQLVLGVAFGGGVYFNYLFLLLWSADVGRLWLGWRCPRGVLWALHAYLALIVVSGAIVFEPGPTRYLGLATLLAAGAWLCFRRAAKSSAGSRAWFANSSR